MNQARSAPAHNAGSEATAPAGTFRGRRSAGVVAFKGIPYARSPVGALRFAPPVRLEPSSAPQDATRFGPISIQDIDPLPLAIPGTENNFYARGVVASEDCLNLNIWTPDVGGRAPVLVWIHGGAFLCGSGTGLWTDGSRQARDNGLVVVTLNYRLGYLGGLYLGDHDPQRSNLALQDQLLALRWVKENIAAFGGDPDCVTIGGQSAGAMSVAALVVAPAGQGLFRRAFIESGHLDAFINLAMARATTAFLLDRLGVDAQGDVLGQLEALSTFRITALQRELGISRRAFPLVADAVTLPVDPSAALAGRSDIDIMIGTTSEEDRLFAVTGWAPAPGGLAGTLAGYLNDAAARAEGEAIYSPLLAARHGDQVALTHLVATDHSWAEPARRLAEVHSAAGGRTFHYEFAWQASALGGRIGAAHLIDLPFFFDNLDAPGVADLLGETSRHESAQRLASGASKALAGFVRSGDPGGPLGAWPPFKPQHRATRVLDTNSSIEIDRLADRLDFWARHRADAVPALSTISGGAETAAPTTDVRAGGTQ